MPQALPIPFAVDTDYSERKAFADQGLVNAHVKGPSKDGITQAEVWAAPGFTQFADTGDIICRGNIEVDGLLYTVMENGVFTIDADANVTRIGHIPGRGPVLMERNAHQPPQIGVVDDAGNLYIIEGGVIGPGPLYLTNDDIPAVWNSIAFLDQRIILGTADALMVASDINNLGVLPGLNFANAEGRPDGLRGVIAVNLDIWALGHDTIEIWKTDPYAITGFPLTRLSGGVVPKGCLTYGSVQVLDGSLHWIAEDGIVYKSEGYRPMPAGNKAVSRDIAKLTRQELDDLHSYSYELGGFAFYGITTDYWTWELNSNTGLWARRKSAIYDRWWGQFTVQVGTFIFAGTFNDGKIYRVDPDSRYEPDGSPVLFEVRSGPMGPFDHRVGVSDVRLRMATGSAELTGTVPEVSPQIMLDYTDNGGATWSATRYLSLGKVGEYAKQIKTTRLGSITEDRTRTWRLRCSDPHIVALLSAQASVS